VPGIADVHVSRVEGLNGATRLGAHYPAVESYLHVLLPNLDIYRCSYIQRQWFLRAAVVVSAVRVPVDDVQTRVSREEPHAWDAITIVAAILAGGCDVKDVTPLFLDACWRDRE
jgi:hypothetical protein